MWEISKVVKEKWEGLSEDEKSPFNHEYEMEMVSYERGITHPLERRVQSKDGSHGCTSSIRYSP